MLQLHLGSSEVVLRGGFHLEYPEACLGLSLGALAPEVLSRQEVFLFSLSGLVLGFGLGRGLFCGESLELGLRCQSLEVGWLAEHVGYLV